MKVAVNNEIIDSFKKIVGEAYVIIDETKRTEYGHDKTEDYQFTPDIVIIPGSTQEVSEILKVCNTQLINLSMKASMYPNNLAVLAAFLI